MVVDAKKLVAKKHVAKKPVAKKPVAKKPVAKKPTATAQKKIEMENRILKLGPQTHLN